MKRMCVTMKDIRRYQLLTEVIEGKLSMVEASMMLELSYRHSLRLKAKVKKQGLDGLLRQPPDFPPNLKITDKVRNKILRLRKKLYWDFNVQHFREKLEEFHEIKLSHETIRQLLIKEKDYKPKVRKPVYRKRRRMPKAGMLVQMDTSEHLWIKSILDKWFLIAMIDDATNEVPFAYFVPSDTTFANMYAIRKYLEIKGLFISLYVDKASHFTTTRYGGLHVDVAPEQEDTHIERALEDLGITLIPANSPQAKGRIERLFRTFQDRLIKEMRLAKIKNYEQANIFLQKQFLPWYNQRFIHEAENVYMPLPKKLNLDIVFSKKYIRAVLKDHTIQIMGHTLQIPPSKHKLSLAGHKVTVCLFPNNKIAILYQNKVVAESVLSKNNKTVKKQKRVKAILSQRSYESDKKQAQQKKKQRPYIPPKNHPWKLQFKLHKERFQRKEVSVSM